MSIHVHTSRDGGKITTCYAHLNTEDSVKVVQNHAEPELRFPAVSVFMTDEQLFELQREIFRYRTETADTLVELRTLAGELDKRGECEAATIIESACKTLGGENTNAA